MCLRREQIDQRTVCIYGSNELVDRLAKNLQKIISLQLSTNNKSPRINN